MGSPYGFPPMLTHLVGDVIDFLTSIKALRLSPDCRVLCLSCSASFHVFIIFTLTCLKETVLKPVCIQSSLCAAIMLTIKSICSFTFPPLLWKSPASIRVTCSWEDRQFYPCVSYSFCFKHFNIVLCGTEEIWQIFILDCCLLFFFFFYVAFLIILFLSPQPTPSSFARPPCLVAAHSVHFRVWA